MKLLGPVPAADLDVVDKIYVDQACAQKIASVLVDFGEDDTTAGGIALATWAQPGMAVVCVPDPIGTADHSAEDAAVEGVMAMVTYVEPGIGFDVLAVCPGGTFGQYLFQCVA